MRAAALAILLLPAAIAAQSSLDLQGVWRSAPGGGGTELYFRITRSPAGKYSGTCEILTMSIPLSGIRVSGNSAEFEIPAIESTFHGEWKDGKVAGVMVTRGREVRATLELVSRTVPSETAAPAPRDVVEWLRRNAVPLATVDPGHGFADLMPLKSMAGGVRIVAMGEATHGTHEFFRFKHRMLEFLAGEMGFTVFAMEAGWPESLAINEYVQNGTGDPERALRGLEIWPPQTEEVLDLIHWMRAYNQDAAHTAKLRFYGVDMQSDRTARAMLAEYLDRVDPGSTGASAEQLDERRAAYIARSSERDWTLARHEADIVAQYAAGVTPARRDRFMAENAKWILDHEPPGTRMLLWAHNGHVATATPEPDPTMGMHLRRMYGSAYMALGFAFDRGTFRANGRVDGRFTAPREFTVGAAVTGSFDRTLAETGLPMFVVDLRHAPQWLNEKHRVRYIGSTYNEAAPLGFYVSLSPAQTFDAVIFMEQTTPSRPIPNRSADPPARLPQPR